MWIDFKHNHIFSIWVTFVNYPHGGRSMTTTQEAVVSLRPNVEWSMSGDDVEGITWHTENVTPLTQSEVDAEIIRLETLKVEQVAADAAATAAAVAHAKSLGFTDAMIAVMYPNLGSAA
jgi:hypothetical protein